jgi:tetratricopeptide (TPR) repeat protein
MNRLFPISVLLLILIACGDQNTSSQDQQNQTKQETQQVKSGEFEDSTLLDLNEKIRADINNPDLYLERAERHLELENPKAAVADIGRAFGIDSTYLPTLIAQASYLAKRGEVNSGLNILERAKSLYPEESDVYTALSEVFLIARNSELSLKNADLAIKYNMYNAKAYYLKGYNFLELGDTSKAISSYQTAIEQDPNYFEPYLELGLLFSAQNDPLALQYYENALQVRPDDRLTLYSKGMYEQEHELYNEAIQTYFRAVKKYPNFKEAYHNLGYIHMYYLKLYREAIPYFTDAIEVAPKYYQAYYNRGYSFELMGDINNAAKDYRKALSIRPDYTLAAEGLNRLRQ